MDTLHTRRKKSTPRDQLPTAFWPSASKKLTPTPPSVQQMISFVTPKATTTDADLVAEFITSESPSSPQTYPDPINKRPGPPNIAITCTRPVVQK
uniref:Uncharacterized protein n=1 Tax=Drosophila pseudoobscura pseudoobscura TaxID=46245 RepID=B5DT34_DROPS